MIITISGFHGVGKSVYAKKIAEKYNLKYLSSGLIFRKIAEERNVSIEVLTKIAESDPKIDMYIDNRIKEEALKYKNVVAEGLLTGWFLKDIADIKIWIKARDDIRFRRIAERDNLPLDEAARRTKFREKSEIERFKKFYQINILDLTIYDFVIDTSFLTIDDVLEILNKIIVSYMRRWKRE